MSKVTIIIPIFGLNLDAQRLSNFEIVFRNLIPFKIPTIIVEQVEDLDQLTLTNLALSKLAVPFVKYLPIKSKTHFNKSQLINEAAKVSTTEYIWEMDADCMLPIHSIIKNLAVDVIKPFNFVIKLNKEETQLFKKIRSYDSTGKNISFVKNFGPLSFIIKKDLFWKLGGMDESFSGYGWEDLAFAEKVKSTGCSIFEVQEPGIHLWHKKSKSGEDEAANRNRFIDLVKKLPSTTEELSKFTESAESAETALSPIANIVHVISPALSKEKPELLQREMLAIQSILKDKNSTKTVPIKLVMATKFNFSSQFPEFLHMPIYRTSKELSGDNREFVLLSDVLDAAFCHADENSIVFYSNSDCCLREGTYERLASTKKEAVEYHRQDVKNSPKTLDEVFLFPREVMPIGIDGVAFRQEFYLKAIRPLHKLNFFLGQPHWDTCIGGLLRKINASLINTRDLFHPIHPTYWPKQMDRPAAVYNTELYHEYLEYNLLKTPVLDAPGIDTSIVLVHFGDDPKRVRAVKESFRELDKQQLEAEIIFVEAISDSIDRTHFPELDQHPLVKHIKIKMEPKNKGLCHKEAMMNIGGKNATKENVIFIDTDIYCKDLTWTTKIRKKLIDDPGAMVQGFALCFDSEDPDHNFVSQAAIYSGYQCDLLHNPGMCWGLTRKVLEKNDYFNPYIFYGSGDSLLFSEYSGRDDWILSFPKIKNVWRNLPIKCNIQYVDTNIVHVNHGFVSTEFYKTRHKLLDTFEGELSGYLEIGSNQLLAYK